MKKAKKIIAIIMCVITMFSVAIQSFAAEVSTNYYEILLNHGYPTNYLDKLTPEVMQEMVESIEDNSVSNVEIKEITFNNTNTNVNARANIKAENLTLQISTTTISPINTDKISGVLVVVTWEWAKLNPYYRGKDAITVNWDNNIFAFEPDSFYACDAYKSKATDEWETFKEYTTLASANQGGIGHWTDLKAFKNFVGGTMLFVLKPTSPMKTGKTNCTNVNVEYAHARSALTGLSFAYKDVGVGFSWENECPTMATPSTVEFSR